MHSDQSKPAQPTAADAPAKLTALTVPTSAVPLELLRKYSSPKPLRDRPEHPSQPKS